MKRAALALASLVACNDISLVGALCAQDADCGAGLVCDRGLCARTRSDAGAGQGGGAGGGSTGGGSTGGGGVIQHTCPDAGSDAGWTSSSGTLSSVCALDDAGYMQCVLMGAPPASIISAGDFVGAPFEDLLISDGNSFWMLEGVSGSRFRPAVPVTLALDGGIILMETFALPTACGHADIGLYYQQGTLQFWAQRFMSPSAAPMPLPSLGQSDTTLASDVTASPSASGDSWLVVPRFITAQLQLLGTPRATVLLGSTAISVAPLMEGGLVFSSSSGFLLKVSADGGSQLVDVGLDFAPRASGRIASGLPGVVGDEVFIIAYDGGAGFVDQAGMRRPAVQRLADGGVAQLSLDPINDVVHGASPGHVAVDLITWRPTGFFLYPHIAPGTFGAPRFFSKPGPMRGLTRYAVDGGADEAAVVIARDDGGLLLVMPP